VAAVVVAAAAKLVTCLLAQQRDACLVTIASQHCMAWAATAVAGHLLALSGLRS
jgi:hypothetical protein